MTAPEVHIDVAGVEAGSPCDCPCHGALTHEQVVAILGCSLPEVDEMVELGLLDPMEVDGLDGPLVTLASLRDSFVHDADEDSAARPS